MVVSSAGRALEVIPTFRPHVVISDLAMPGMDGYALARTIAANVADPPPVIAISGACERTRRAAIAGSRVREAPGQACRLQRLVATIAELTVNVNFAE